MFVDEVLRLFIDKLGTNRLFYNFLWTKIASLWSPTGDGKLETCSATFSYCEASLRRNFKELIENVRETPLSSSKIL